jgi:uncharacterized membrane protein
MSGKPASFELLFSGFDFFVESLIVTLLLLAASLVIAIPVGGIMFALIAIGAAGGEGAVWILLVFMAVMFFGIFLISMIIHACFAFAYPLVVDRRMTALDAVKASFRGVMTNLVGILIATIVFSIIYVFASCLCWFPAILFAPIPLGVFAILSREVFPVTAKPEILS